MNVVFAGTPDFAATILQGLLTADVVPSLVLTQPDRPSGRGRKLQPSAVKRLAEEHGLPVMQPASLRPNKPAGQEALSSLLEKPMDLLVVAAYGLILPKALLDHPRHGAINVHASLLPRWRGAAPIERAIMAGDNESGVTLMQMDEGLDTGGILAKSSCSIEGDITGAEATQRFAVLGTQLLLNALPDLGQLQPQPQNDDEATYAAKLEAAEAQIDWHNDAVAIHDKVRALTGRMTAYTHAATEAQDPVRIRVLRSSVVNTDQTAPPGTLLQAPKGQIHVACTNDAIRLHALQLNIGKGKPMDAAAALNGYPALFSKGRQLTSG